MSIKLQLPKLTDLKPRITVIGVGGAGGNALNNMIASGLDGVEFVAANTDAQALAMSGAEHRIQLGVNLTEGLGAGSKPEIGQAAAEEAVDEIRQQLSGSHMCFIAAGMGGGTGTGAAAVIARVAQELGVLTVGVVTKPFQFEGARRMRMAEAGIVELRQHVDTLIVIPNQNLFRIATERTTFSDAFLLADQVLHSGVACIVDLIVREGLINLDFADVRTVMANMGNAMMGTGEGSGDNRAIEAAEAAIHNPLIDDISLKGAKGLLLSVTGGRDLTLYEVDEAASRVRQEVDPDANIIVGATFDDSLTDKVRVSIVASGITRLGEMASVGPRSARGAPVGNAALFGLADAGEVSRHVSVHGLQSDVDSAPGGVAFDPSPMALHDSRGGERLDDAPLDLVEDIASDAGIAEDGTGSTPAPSAVWKGPGGVSIVEEMPRLLQASEPRPVSVHHSAVGMAADPAVPAFRPAPPVEARQPARRMPDVTDFPPVGQREYMAKSQPVQTGADRAAAAQAAERKPRFFERWTNSLQRRLGESPTKCATGDAHYDITAALPGAPGTAHPGDGQVARSSTAGASQAENDRSIARGRKKTV